MLDEGAIYAEGVPDLQNGLRRSLEHCSAPLLSEGKLCRIPKTSAIKKGFFFRKGVSSQLMYSLTGITSILFKYECIYV
ncbi:hypothetical protein BRADI_1g06637v3 [Brachypodium distachyon]|uniref:Uncharacterized protein n=1 Tax=Brachypodium distachyon TaxID=15368 RepID=A0A2K2DIC3_BRADI|nr:hypothetical protein BRADI_1g06637v3 [Brachypodium distachyon]